MQWFLVKHRDNFTSYLTLPYQMDKIMRFKQVIYWPNFVTIIGRRIRRTSQSLTEN